MIEVEIAYRHSALPTTPVSDDITTKVNQYSSSVATRTLIVQTSGRTAMLPLPVTAPGARTAHQDEDPTNASRDPLELHAALQHGAQTQSILRPAIKDLRTPPASLHAEQLAILPTLFPSPLANLISALATSARLSLRITAFFVEAIIETSQYATRTTLGYTRRVLISAISSARRMYLMAGAVMEGTGSEEGYYHDRKRVLAAGHKCSNHDLDVDIDAELGLVPGSHSNASSTLDIPTTDAFLQVLERYTNLGIYIIHHTFTMAELFTMSGFYLTSSAVQSAHYAAQESVALFDSIFGSNESSRALSSIISMVRRELLEDERFKAKEKGKIASLTALTKAMTAFACLQNATWSRSSEKFRMKL